MPKGNPRPVQTERFKQGWFKPQGEIPPGEKLASKILGVRRPCLAGTFSLVAASDW
jgi:hypothetical protein